MTGVLAILVIGIVTPAVFLGLMYSVVGKRKADMRDALGILEKELEQKSQMRDEIKSLYGGMVSILSLSDAVKELKSLQESLKAERGRITITQTELETVETRLCELEEIERELEASNLETKEELNILKKKETELRKKNDALKNQIATSMGEFENVVKELEMSTAMLEQIDRMKKELVNAEEKVETLLVQIDQMNEQYVNLKMRYDALDIEYAQLYEKFSDAEAMMARSEGS